MVDATSAAWGHVVTFTDYIGLVLAKPWFWPTFFGLTGFAAGLYLDAFMRRWPAAKRQQPATASQANLSPPKPSVVEPKPIPEPPREFVDITPEYLYGLGAKGLTTVQTNLLVRPLIGKWMRLVGFVLQVSESVVILRSENDPDVIIPYMIVLEISDEWKPKFHVLEKQKKIAVIGQIQAVESTQMTLRNCETVSGAPAQISSSATPSCSSAASTARNHVAGNVPRASLLVIELTGSEYPGRYWTDLKRKLFEKEGFKELYAKIAKLPFPGTNGKIRTHGQSEVGKC